MEINNNTKFYGAGSAPGKGGDIVVGLDIGTSKICALVASRGNNAESMRILGVGLAKSEGINRGSVINIDKTVHAISLAIEQAEQQSGFKITEVTVGIAGDHIQAFPTHGVIGISNPNHEITEADVKRVIEESKNIKLASDRTILHVIPQNFIIDDQSGINDPVGMSGVRMEANVYVITAMQTAVMNIYRCIEKLNIKVKNIILEPLASSNAVLDDEEKEVGVALVDIGGGTTDIAIFKDNMLRFTSIFGIAGRQVTDDIRAGLGIIASQAERIKQEFGHAYVNSIMEDDVFMIPGIGGRKPLEVSKSVLAQIIQPRMEEIFDYTLSEIRRSGVADHLGAGIVLTGGCTLLKGVEELAQDCFGMPVKIGFPSSLSYSGLADEIKNPLFSTSVGLAMTGFEDLERNSVNYSDSQIPETNSEETKPEEESQSAPEMKHKQSKTKKAININDQKDKLINKVKNFLSQL